MLLVTMNADFASRCGYNRRESTMFLSVYTTEEGTEVTEETGSQEERRNGDARSFLATKEHELTNAVTPLVGFQLDMIEQSLRSSPCLRSSCEPVPSVNLCYVSSESPPRHARDRLVSLAERRLQRREIVDMQGHE